MFSHSNFFLLTKSTFVAMRFCLNSSSCSVNVFPELFSALKSSVPIDVTCIFTLTYDDAHIYYMYSYV